MALFAFVFGLPRRWRRWSFVTRTKLLARLMGVELHLDVHPSVTIDRGATVKLTRGKPIHLTIGEGTVLEEGFYVQFFAHIGHAPRLEIGPKCVFHRNVTLVVGGELTFAGGNEIGVGSVFRCSQLIEIGALSGSGEYISVFDFLHAIDEDLTVVFQSVLVPLPVRIGSLVMLGSKCTVNPGTVISDVSLVMPGAVASGVWDTPATLMGGVPAKSFEKPEVFPLLENPFISAAVSWMGDRPGPGFRTIDEARGVLPEPTAYVKEDHGWEPTLDRIKARQAEREARAKATGPATPAE